MLDKYLLNEKIISTDLHRVWKDLPYYRDIDAEMSNLMEYEVAYFSCYHLLGLLNNSEDSAGWPGFLIVFLFHFAFFFI